MYKTYDVHGSTAAEARASALAGFGLKSEKGEPMMGSTSGPMKVTNFRIEASHDGFEGTYVTTTRTVKSADVELNQTIMLPNWVESGAASEADQSVEGKRSYPEGARGRTRRNQSRTGSTS